MTYLVILLLLFGFFQSFLELKKDDVEKNKLAIKKTLSAIYIFTFVIASIITIISTISDNKNIDTLNDISFSVKKIDSSSQNLSVRLNKSIKETEKLVIQSDSMNLELKKAYDFKSLLINETKKLNNNLSSQIRKDSNLLKISKPILALLESDMILTVNSDSTVKNFEYCIRNIGKRTAILKSLKGNILFFNKDNAVVHNIVSFASDDLGVLTSSEIEGQRICPASNAFSNKINLKQIQLIAIYVDIQFEDILDGSINNSKLFSGWNSGEFSKLREWQKKIVIDWLSANKN